MKYTSNNKPPVCMQTQSTCYKGTRKMTIKGILWHSTGANNPALKRYIQPSDVKPAADTYTKSKWLEVLGKNTYGNDWNHIDHQAGLNCWIGKLANGSVATVQTMPWDYRPWGCGKGSKGTCNDGWIQFEICEDGLTDKDYFNKVYKEACEITAYLCKLYNIDPNGTATLNGVKVPTILCHYDSHNLGLGSNHGDIYHWFKKHGKDMTTARKDVTALLASAGSTTTSSSSTVKTYKVVTPINKYTTAGDAAAQKNALTNKLAVGTYYIYTKYPDGVNGMYNISTDKTGASAGSWINPKENVVKESVDTAKYNLYRVRKSKDDTKSQVGAYSVLQNAIDACQKAGAGYHVFDSSYTIVYSYKAPVTEEKQPEEVKPKEEPIIVAVYDLDYPEKTKIVDKGIKRSNIDCVRAIKKILSNNNSFDIEIAKAFFKIAPKYGIDPIMAIAQSILETGWFNYTGSAVTTEQHNYCGLGVTSNGVKGGNFDTIEDGVAAQLQHLFAYGCKDAIPSGEIVVDPRFSLVTRGIAVYWQQLAGRWACPGYDKAYATPQEAMEAGKTYGQKILALAKTLLATSVSEDELEKYFPSKPDEPVIKDETNIEIEDEQNNEAIEPSMPENEEFVDNDIIINEDELDDKASNIAMLIFKCMKKLILMLVELFNKGE